MSGKAAVQQGFSIVEMLHGLTQPVSDQANVVPFLKFQYGFGLKRGDPEDGKHQRKEQTIILHSLSILYGRRIDSADLVV